MHVYSARHMTLSASRCSKNSVSAVQRRLFVQVGVRYCASLSSLLWLTGDRRLPNIDVNLADLAGNSVVSTVELLKAAKVLSPPADESLLSK